MEFEVTHSRIWTCVWKSIEQQEDRETHEDGCKLLVENTRVNDLEGGLIDQST